MQKKRNSQFNRRPRRLVDLINENIRNAKVRLISSSGEQVGVIDTKDALKMAREENLDLVLINTSQEVPVAKIIDYGKFKFEKDKQEKEKKKKSKQQALYKELKIRPRIEKHDLEIREKWIKKWLEEGNKVRVVAILRGREIQHPKLAQQVLQGVINSVEEFGKPDQDPPIVREGKIFSLNLVPNSF